MEILQELIKRKLEKLTKKQPSSSQFTLMKTISSANMANKSKSQDRSNSSNWNITSQQDLQKATTHMTERPSKLSAERDILRINRRKRQRETRDERRRQNVENNQSNVNDSKTTGLDLQLVPIHNTVSEEPEEVVPISRIPTSTMNSRPPLLSLDYTSDDDSVSLSSSDFLIDNFVQNTNTEMQADLQNEMRNVLQALFGEIRHIPQLSYGGRSRNSANDLRPSRTASH